MRKKYSAVILVFVLLVAAGGGVPAYAEDPGPQTESMDTLMSTVSINDADLEAEADQLGIPPGEKKRYVVSMRSINQQYQEGSLTRTEYIQWKRNLIDELKK